MPAGAEPAAVDARRARLASPPCGRARRGAAAGPCPTRAACRSRRSGCPAVAASAGSGGWHWRWPRSSRSSPSWRSCARACSPAARRAAARRGTAATLRPSPRMQYTASSFAQPLTALFAPLAAPRRRLAPPVGLFPRTASLERRDAAIPSRGALYAAALRGARPRPGAALRWLQHGRVQLYVLYIALTLAGRCCCGSWRRTDERDRRSVHPLSALAPRAAAARRRSTARRRSSPAAAARRCCSRTTICSSCCARARSTATTTTWVFRAGPVVGLWPAVIAAPFARAARRRCPRRCAFPGDFLLLAVAARRWCASSRSSPRSTPARASRAWAPAAR